MDNGFDSDTSITIGQRVIYDGRRVGTIKKRGWMGPDNTMWWTVQFDDGAMEPILCGLQPLTTACVECDKEVKVRDLAADYVCPECRKEQDGSLKE